MITSIRNGNWGDTVPATSPWPSGTVPTASDDVTVAHEINLPNGTAAHVKSLTFYGAEAESPHIIPGAGTSSMEVDNDLVAASTPNRNPDLFDVADGGTFTLTVSGRILNNSQGPVVYNVGSATIVVNCPYADCSDEGSIYENGNAATIDVTINVDEVHMRSNPALGLGNLDCTGTVVFNGDYYLESTAMSDDPPATTNGMEAGVFMAAAASFPTRRPVLTINGDIHIGAYGTGLYTTALFLAGAHGTITHNGDLVLDAPCPQFVFNVAYGDLTGILTLNGNLQIGSDYVAKTAVAAAANVRSGIGRWTGATVPDVGTLVAGGVVLAGV
jgi:hypothetical protein